MKDNILLPVQERRKKDLEMLEALLKKRETEDTSCKIAENTNNATAATDSNATAATDSTVNTVTVATTSDSTITLLRGPEVNDLLIPQSSIKGNNIPTISITISSQVNG